MASHYDRPDDRAAVRPSSGSGSGVVGFRRRAAATARGAGPAAAAALVENELLTIQDILEMPAETLVPILGPGKGPQLLERLQNAVRNKVSDTARAAVLDWEAFRTDEGAKRACDAAGLERSTAPDTAPELIFGADCCYSEAMGDALLAVLG
jgi:hypothetical protein